MKTHDWSVEHNHKVKTQHVDKFRGHRCGDSIISILTSTCLTMWDRFPSDRKRTKWTTIWQCRLGTCLIIIYTQITTNWQVVGFFLYDLLLPQIASHSFQNLPFCSPERGQQGLTLPVDTTHTSPHLSFQPFPLLSPLSNQIEKYLVPGTSGNRH
jgi:hypothetical protein